MVLAALLVLPFLNTPFTIDDPIYLREAQHALVEPLHPQAFTMVWSTDLDLRASQILPGGIVVPYLLVPTALMGCAEWAGHLTQLVLLLSALAAVALLALRAGLDDGQARFAGLLTATCPAVLGISVTLMPDIAAMLFVVLGMERIMAWRDDRKWHQALLATCWLVLAALTRTHTTLALVPACIFLLDGISAAEIRESFRRFPVRFLPILLTPVVCFIVAELTADPDFEGNTLVNRMLFPYGASLVVKNACAFLAHLMIVIPLTIPWLIMRQRQLNSTLLLIAALTATLLYLRLGWITFVAGATAVALVDILLDAVERRDRNQLALWSWLFLAAPVIVYLHLPSKYLLPSVPAAVVLVVRLLPQAHRGTLRWLIPSVVTAGAILGLLIILGVRDLAETQRLAVADLIEPRIGHGERVWFAGHWGFQWYAELAGAVPVTQLPPLPQRGDIIVVSQIDFPLFAQKWKGAHNILQRSTYRSRGPGRVMDFQDRAGFFSSPFGYLPWIWGSGGASRFEVWEVE